MADTTSAVFHTTDTSRAQKCASRGKHAKLLCTACNHCPVQSDNDVSTIYYCDRDCQVSHWTKHKTECKARIARRSLYRAADIAQKIWLELCEQTCADRVLAVTNEGKTLRIETQNIGDHMFYHPFPSMIGSDLHDRMSVAVLSNCDIGMIAMWEVIKVLFQGVDLSASMNRNAAKSICLGQDVQFDGFKAKSGIVLEKPSSIQVTLVC